MVLWLCLTITKKIFYSLEILSEIFSDEIICYLTQLYYIKIVRGQGISSGTDEKRRSELLAVETG